MFVIDKWIAANTSSHTATHGSGRDKFEPVDSPLMPPAIASWQNTLKAVNSDPSMLDSSRRWSPHDGKYLFPEPGIFAGAGNDARRARYFSTWEHARDICLFRVSGASSPPIPLSPQDWRNFLIGNLVGTFKGKTNQVAQEKLRKIFANCLDELSMDFETFTPTNIDPPPVAEAEAQKVLWELSELNFRFELLALDKRAVKIVSDEEAQDRQDLIAKCFPGSEFIPKLRDATQGLASSDWKERLPILLRLRALMRDWRGNKPTPLLLPDLPAVSLYKEQDVQILEDAVARFYAQQFFCHFGRAAVIPTRLIN